jgi:hypothetical protein
VTTPAKKSPDPSVKDPELHEKLRGEGNSKKWSARIANAAATSSRKKVFAPGLAMGGLADGGYAFPIERNGPADWRPIWQNARRSRCTCA